MFLNSQLNRQFVCYCIVGVGLTIGGLACAFILIWLGVPIYLANFLAYFVGCCISYLLNSKYTFGQQCSKKRAIKFFIGVAIAYIVNVLAIYLSLLYDPTAKYSAQLIGSIFYTVLSFLINKFWVME